MANENNFKTKTVIDPDKILNERWLIPRKMLVEDEQVSAQLKNKKPPLQMGKLQAIVDRSIDRINDSVGIKELLPDTKLIGEILVASILNPKDLNEIKLNIQSDDILMPPEMLEEIRYHFTNVYDLESELSTILSESLIEKGCYPLLPIPASLLYNTMMSGGHVLESISKNQLQEVVNAEYAPIGILSAPPSGKNELYAMESLTEAIYTNNPNTTGTKENLLTISDNPLYLLKSGFKRANKQLLLNNYLKNTVGLEALNKVEKSEVNSVYFKKIYDFVESVAINKVNPEEVGKNMHPIIFKIPAESIIPIYVPGEPENHVGYYVIYDEFGNPVRATKNSNFFKELNDKLEGTIQNQGNNYIKTTLIGNTTNGNKKLEQSEQFQQPVVDAYIYKLENDLKNAVKNGMHGENVEIAHPEDLFRVMFSRQLLKMKTRAVYIPAELMTYVAFNYNEMGMGISLIEKTKLYSSLRAIMMFAEILAGIKNSVPGRILNITLDEADPDPQATIETILQEFTALQSIGLPLGKLNPSDIVEGIQRANIQVKVDGGEIFPNTSIEIEDKHREMTKPDSDLSDFLKKQHYSGFGVTPELVDKGLEGDFATSIRASNLLQSKRDLMHQKTFTYFITDHIHKYIFAGGPLYQSLKDKWDKVVEKGKGSFAEIIQSIYCELPKPDTAVITNQMAAFEEYSAFIDKVIPIYISEDILKNILKGEYTADALLTTQQSIAAYMKRQYIRRQNILPELDEMIISEDNGTVENLIGHNKSILQLIGDLLPSLYEMEYDEVDKKAMDAIKELNAKKEKDYPEGTPSNAGGSSTSSSNELEGSESSNEESGSGLSESDLGLDSGESESESSNELDTSELGLDSDKEKKPETEESSDLKDKDLGLNSDKEEPESELKKDDLGLDKEDKSKEEKDLSDNELGLD